MRTLVVLFVFLACFPVPALTAQSLDDLLGRYNFGLCRDCHHQEFEEFRKSFHAISVTDALPGIYKFLTAGVQQEWKQPLTKAHLLKCLDCHAPIINYASEELAVSIAEMIIEASETKNEKRKSELLRELGRLNVNCIACHNIKATTIAIGLLGQPERDAIYTTGSAETSEHRTVTVNSLDKSLFCAQCHGRYMAPDGEQIVCNTLNGSYYDGYVAQGGSDTCQDCHMKRDGRGHHFPGGHNREIVMEGIGFEAEIQGVRHTVGEAVPTAVIQASLTNKAGHRIPDG
jgi:hypothetical protein